MKRWIHNNIYMPIKGKWDRLFYYDTTWKRPICLLLGHRISYVSSTVIWREPLPNDNVAICRVCHKYFKLKEITKNDYHRGMG